MGGLKKRFTGLVAFVATLAMVLGMVTPAFAADGEYTVTINNTEGGHTYKAYQILDGDVYSDGSRTYLSNVKWGDGITPSTLLANLSKDTTSVVSGGSTSTIGSLFGSATDAPSVANILSDNIENSVVATQFAEAASLSKNDDAVAGTSTEVKDGSNKTVNYTLKLNKPGYFLIEDEAGTAGSTSRHILRVFNKEESLSTKSATPTVEKKVQENVKAGEENAYGVRYNDTADFSIGDSVPFKLIGSIPDGIKYYDYYKYEFTDTLSLGLTAPDKDAVKVYLASDKNFDPANPGSNQSAVEVTSQFDVAVANQVITVKPKNNSDLKLVTGIDTKIPGSNDLLYKYVIVTYNATLNSSAAIGRANVGSTKEGNVNKVQLAYSNNPNNKEAYSSTPEDKVIVFTYGVDINKFNADLTQSLNGAEFKLYRMKNDQTTKEYAIVGNDGRLIRWGNENEGSVLKTGDTNSVSVTGLDDGRYFITETKAPDGYNKASEDWSITVAANTSNGQDKDTPTTALLTSLSATLTGNKADTSEKTQDVSVSEDTGVVTAKLRNTQGFQLPSTGGLGTMVLTIAGIAIVACAGIILTIRKRANDEQ